MIPEDDLPSSDPEAPAQEQTEPTLPPVEPPSAGFIVQLFLVPAVIVAGVVGVYLLFGRLASGELDWRKQVLDVRSENPHVRWRAALGLAQMLDADAQRGESGQQLAANAEIAETLTTLFDETRRANRRDEETDRQIEFLTKALGRLDRGDLVFPSLLDTARSDDDEKIRKHALTAIAMIAGRAFERETPLDDAEVTLAMIGIASSDDVLSRHQAAFILGLLGSPEAHAKLESLLSDADLMTRVNAAIGLARNDSKAGLFVFEDVLRDATAHPLSPAAASRDDTTLEEYAERAVIIANCLKALDLLNPQFTEAESDRLADALRQVSEATGDERIRLDDKDLSLRLAGAGE